MVPDKTLLEELQQGSPSFLPLSSGYLLLQSPLIRSFLLKQPRMITVRSPGSELREGLLQSLDAAAVELRLRFEVEFPGAASGHDMVLELPV